MIDLNVPWPHGFVWGIVGGFVAVLILGGLVVRYVGRPVGELLQGWREFSADWKGTPARAGVEAQPGVMSRIAALETGQEVQRDETRKARSEVAGLATKVEKGHAQATRAVDDATRAVAGAVQLAAETQDDLAKLRESMSTVVHEVTPNGGESMKDKQNENVGQIEVLTKGMNQIREHLGIEDHN